MSATLRPNGKVHFVSQLSKAARILDLACGNNSPFQVKSVLPKSIYTGIGIVDYNQTMPNKADHYITTWPERFAGTIARFVEEFDATISSPNLEDYNDWYATFEAMLGATRVDGKIYLSFPSERSVNFPPRADTLNSFDDSTHQGAPPDFDQLQDMAKQHGFEVVFCNLLQSVGGDALAWVGQRADSPRQTPGAAGHLGALQFRVNRHSQAPAQQGPCCRLSLQPGSALGCCSMCLSGVS